MSSNIEAQFDNAMMDIYRKALKEAQALPADAS